MSRRTLVMTVAAGLAVHALLAAGALAALPAEARVALAFLVLVLLPGYAAIAAGIMPPGGPWLAPGWALGFGVAWQGAMVLATRALGLPFTILGWGSLATTALLWAPVLARRPAAAARPPDISMRATPDLSPRATHGAWIALLLASALGAWYAGRLGTPLGIQTDSPDHIGTIRRMMASGDAFPRDAFFRDAGAEGADPRKGLWHPQVALIARLASADPVVTWRFLPACLVPLFVLNAAVVGWLLRGPPGAAVAGWALLLTYGGSLAEQILREAGYATKLGDQLALATAAAVLADLARPARRHRLAALGLALGAIAAHIYYVIQFAMVFPALAAGLALADRGFSPRVRRLVATAGLIGLAVLPYLAWRVTQSYAPVNIIHTQPQGLLWLADGVAIVSHGVLWDWLGYWWVLFPLASPWLWRAGRRNPAVLYLLTTPLVVALVIFNPPVVARLEPRLGYLLMRMVWMIPLAALLGWMLTGLAGELARGPRRFAAALALAGILVLSLEPLADIARVLSRPGAQAAHERGFSAEPWRDALAWMDSALAPGSVVLSDPATSYSIPMWTRHYVMTLADQHSSPNDGQALQRILDARDAMDPYASATRVREVLARHRVNAIALNDRFPSPPQLDYWTPRHAWFVPARARFDAAPAAFERVFDRDGFVVYRVREEGLATFAAPPPRPYLAPWPPQTSPQTPPQTPTGTPAGAPPETPAEGRSMGPGLPALCGFTLAPRAAAPGDTVRGVAEWHADAALAPGAYSVAVRFDRPLPGTFRPPAAIGKPWRKLIERIHGERYRFREDHIPVGGAYGVDLWTPDQVVRDSFTVVVPGDVAAGDYRVGIRMLVQPHYANYRLSDWLSDDDTYSGLDVGPFHVGRRSDPGGR